MQGIESPLTANKKKLMIMLEKHNHELLLFRLSVYDHCPIAMGQYSWLSCAGGWVSFLVMRARFVKGLSAISVQLTGQSSQKGFSLYRCFFVLFSLNLLLFVSRCV